MLSSVQMTLFLYPFIRQFLVWLVRCFYNQCLLHGNNSCGVLCNTLIQLKKILSERV